MKRLISLILTIAILFAVYTPTNLIPPKAGNVDKSRMALSGDALAPESLFSKGSSDKDDNQTDEIVIPKTTLSRLDDYKVLTQIPHSSLWARSKLKEKLIEHGFNRNVIDVIIKGKDIDKWMERPDFAQNVKLVSELYMELFPSVNLGKEDVPLVLDFHDKVRGVLDKNAGVVRKLLNTFKAKLSPEEFYWFRKTFENNYGQFESEEEFIKELTAVYYKEMFIFNCSVQIVSDGAANDTDASLSPIYMAPDKGAIINDVLRGSLTDYFRDLVLGSRLKQTFFYSRGVEDINVINADDPVSVLLMYWKYSEDEKSRLNSMRIIGEIGDQKAIIPIINSFGFIPSSFPMILDSRNVFLSSLARIGGVDGIIGPLIAALNDPDIWVRRNAAWMLGEIGDKMAVQPLIAALNDRNWVEKDEVVISLGQLGDGRAVQPLIDAAKRMGGLLRQKLAVAFEKLKDKRAFDILIEYTKAMDDKQLRSYSAIALGEIGDVRALDSLIVLMKSDPFHDVRSSAIGALGKIGDRAVVEKYLNNYLEDPDEMIKRSALSAISDIALREIEQMRVKRELTRENEIRSAHLAAASL